MKSAWACTLLLVLIACTPIMPAPASPESQPTQEPERLKPLDCPNYLRYYEGECVPIITCSDGTLYPGCSQNKPYKCNIDGELEDAANVCGCPRNFTARYGSCEPIKEKPNYREFVIQLNNSDQYWAMPPKYQDPSLYNITVYASDAVQIIAFPDKDTFGNWKNVSSPEYIYVKDCSNAPMFSREIALKKCCLDYRSALIVNGQGAFPVNIRLRMIPMQPMQECNYDWVIPRTIAGPDGGARDVKYIMPPRYQHVTPYLNRTFNFKKLGVTTVQFVIEPELCNQVYCTFKDYNAATNTVSISATDIYDPTRNSKLFLETVCHQLRHAYERQKYGMAIDDFIKSEYFSQYSGEDLSSRQYHFYEDYLVGKKQQIQTWNQNMCYRT